MSNLQDTILQIPLRADRNDDESLMATFVNVGALIPSLKNFNNSLLYGRRGTGKTHVLKFLKASVEEEGDWGIYVDLRQLGSSGSLYSDTSLPLTQRALSLLSDVIKELHDSILNHVMQSDQTREAYLESVGEYLHNLVLLSEEKKLSGDFSVGSKVSMMKQDTGSTSLEAGTSGIHVSLGSKLSDESSLEHSVSQSGELQSYIDFQYVYANLSGITRKIIPHRLWVFIDEFSAISTDLQVYLADMIRKVFAPNPRITFKIAAIKHRTQLIKRFDDGGYLGIEESADVSSYDLDNYLVFGNNQAQSLFFFRELLWHHVSSLLGENRVIKSSNELTQELFTQENAFVELVSAAEGVPRDAFNILANAVVYDYGSKVSIPSIRRAARKWYQDDKQKNVEGYEGASDLLNWIIEQVIGKRHARAFLLRQGGANKLINYLYDSRILHIIKQGISSHDTPGIKYDAFSIDYGCYCDLINSAKSPKGLFEAQEEDWDADDYVSVPKDDYRSIRRAILDLTEYQSANNEVLQRPPIAPVVEP